jgi:hypothetical protein
MRLQNPFTGLTEEQHTRGVNARNVQGIACDPYSMAAVQWCAQGILWRRGWTDFNQRELDGFAGFLWIKWRKSITELNDVGLNPFSFFEMEFESWQDGKVQS